MRATTLKVLGGVIAIAISLGFADGAQAQGVYLGGAYSWATLDVQDVDSELFEDNASAYKVFLGYEFPKLLGLEAGYINFGDYDVGEFEGFEGGQASNTGWTAALTGRIPLGKLFTVYGKVGYFFWDAQFDGEIGDLLEDEVGSGEDPFYGAGVRVNFGNFSILGEYERFDSSEDFNQDLVSLGVRLTF